jgi:hypothetical protein
MAASAALEVVASSYAAAVRLRASCTRLALSAARDVACANLMCARAGGGCACRLAAVLDGLQGARLRQLELARNALPLLPAAVWRREGLVRLDASGNALQSLGLDEDVPPTQQQLAPGAQLAAPLRSPLPLPALPAPPLPPPPLPLPPPLPELEEVDLRNNALRAAALAPLLRDARRFPRLARLLVNGNPAADELRAMAARGALSPREAAMLVLA